eukprot:6822183-Lingulodinium_polyedra.AAC.1
MLHHIHPVSWDECWTVNDPTSYPPHTIPGCYHNGLRALAREIRFESAKLWVAAHYTDSPSA